MDRQPPDGTPRGFHHVDHPDALQGDRFLHIVEMGCTDLCLIGVTGPIMAAYDSGAQPGDFFTAAAHALLDGLARAGVGRLVAVGLAATLETDDGMPLMDTPGFPQEYRPFRLAHAAGTSVLRASVTALDWLIVSPAGDFDNAGARSGRYSVTGVNMASCISHSDFALALLDEIDAPRHHHTHIGVEGA